MYCIYAYIIYICIYTVYMHIYIYTYYRYENFSLQLFKLVLFSFYELIYPKDIY